MAKISWKNSHPASIREAIRLCLDFARDKKNASVARIGDLVGISEWSIYKWMHDGSIPSIRIRPFEHACGCTFITQYIATSARKLTIDIPAGRASSQDDLLDLQNAMNAAVALLTRYYRDDLDSSEVLHGVTSAMEKLAWQRENVCKAEAPELALFPEEGEQ